MKTVQLRNFAVVGGALRQRSEGPIPVTDDEFAMLTELGQVDTDDGAIPENPKKRDGDPGSRPERVADVAADVAPIHPVKKG